MEQELQMENIGEDMDGAEEGRAHQRGANGDSPQGLDGDSTLSTRSLPLLVRVS